MRASAEKCLLSTAILLLCAASTSGRARYGWPRIGGTVVAQWSSLETLQAGGGREVSTTLPDGFGDSFLRPDSTRVYVRASIVAIDGVAEPYDGHQIFASLVAGTTTRYEVLVDQLSGSHTVDIVWQAMTQGPCSAHSHCPVGQYCDVYGGCDVVAVCEILHDTFDAGPCPFDDTSSTCPGGLTVCGEDEVPCGHGCLGVRDPETIPFCGRTPGCAIADGVGSSDAYPSRDAEGCRADAPAFKRALGIARNGNMTQVICRRGACYSNIGKECTRVESRIDFQSGGLSSAACDRIVEEIVSVPGVYPEDLQVTCGCPARETPVPPPVAPPSPRMQGPLVCGTEVSGTTLGGIDIISTPNVSPEHVYTIEASLAGTYIFDSCNSAIDTYITVFSNDDSRVAHCDDCGNCSRVFRARLATYLDAGRYSVIIEGHGASAGEYTLSLTCPTSTTSTMSATTTTTTTFTSETTSTETTSTISTSTISTSTATSTTSSTTTSTTTTSTATTTTTTTTRTTTSTTGTSSTSTLNEYVDILSCGIPVTHSTALVGANALPHPNPSTEHNYNFAAPVDGNYTFDACQSDFDTYIWIFSDTGAMVAECDDFCDGTCSRAYRTRFSVPLVAGNYRVVIEGHREAEGTYSLEVRCPTTRSRVRRSAETCLPNRMGVSVASRAFGEAGLLQDIDTAIQRGVEAVAQPGVTYSSSVRQTCERSTENVGRRRRTVYAVENSTACRANSCTTLSCEPGEVQYISDYLSERTCCPFCLPRSALTTQQLNDFNRATTFFEAAQLSQEKEHYFRALRDWSDNLLRHPNANAISEGVYAYMNRSQHGGQCASASECVTTTTTTSSTTTSQSSTTVTTTSTITTPTTATVTSSTTSTKTATSTTVTSRTTVTATSITTVSSTTSTLVEFVGTLTCDLPVSASTDSVGANARPNPNPSAEHNYNFVAPVDGNYTFDACQSDYDTFIWLVNSAGVTVAQCDDFCDGTCALPFRTRFTAALSAGVYRVIIEGHRTSEGMYHLAVNCPS